MKETFSLRRGRKKAFVHRSSCPASLLHLSVCPLRAWWVPGTLGSYLCNLFHAPSYCPAPVGFQEVLQGCCHVKLPALSSSGRMKQCKELLLLSFLVFTKGSLSFHLFHLLCCLLPAPLQTLLLHPSIPSSFRSILFFFGMFLGPESSVVFCCVCSRRDSCVCATKSEKASGQF